MIEVKVYSVQVNQGEGIGLAKIVGSIENAVKHIEEQLLLIDTDIDDLVILNNPDYYDPFIVVYEEENEFLYGIQEHLVEVKI